MNKRKRRKKENWLHIKCYFLLFFILHLFQIYGNCKLKLTSNINLLFPRTTVFCSLKTDGFEFKFV